MGKILIVKVLDSERKNICNYKNKVNFHDPRLVLLVLKDMESEGLPLKRVMELYNPPPEKEFPI